MKLTKSKLLRLIEAEVQERRGHRPARSRPKSQALSGRRVVGGAHGTPRYWFGVGDSGPHVADLQERLLALGYKLPRYGADADFGKETQRAVIAFQRDNDLKPDGIAGRNTLAYLKAQSIPTDQQPPDLEPGLEVNPLHLEKPLEPILIPHAEAPVIQGDTRRLSPAAQKRYKEKHIYAPQMEEKQRKLTTAKLQKIIKEELRSLLSEAEPEGDPRFIPGFKNSKEAKAIDQYWKTKGGQFRGLKHNAELNRAAGKWARTNAPDHPVAIAYNKSIDRAKGVVHKAKPAAPAASTSRRTRRGAASLNAASEGRGVIRRGHRGDAVEEVQRMVGAVPDGIFGRGTQAKVKAWQEKQGLDPDGVVGYLTGSRMLGKETLRRPTGAADPGRSPRRAPRQRGIDPRSAPDEPPGIEQPKPPTDYPGLHVPVEKKATALDVPPAPQPSGKSGAGYKKMMNDPRRSPHAEGAEKAARKAFAKAKRRFMRPRKHRGMKPHESAKWLRDTKRDPSLEEKGMSAWLANLRWRQSNKGKAAALEVARRAYNIAMQELSGYPGPFKSGDNPFK